MIVRAEYYCLKSHSLLGGLFLLPMTKLWGHYRSRLFDLILSLHFLGSLATATATRNFGTYGSCSQQCITPHYLATGCQCSVGNDCLCGNITYLLQVMADIGSCCSTAEVRNSAQTTIDNCNSNGTPSGATLQNLIDAGNGGSVSACPVAGLAPTQKSSTPSSQSLRLLLYSPRVSQQQILKRKAM